MLGVRGEAGRTHHRPARLTERDHACWERKKARREERRETEIKTGLDASESRHIMPTPSVYAFKHDAAKTTERHLTESGCVHRYKREGRKKRVGPAKSLFSFYRRLHSTYQEEAKEISRQL